MAFLSDEELRLVCVKLDAIFEACGPQCNGQVDKRQLIEAVLADPEVVNLVQLPTDDVGGDETWSMVKNELCWPLQILEINATPTITRDEFIDFIGRRAGMVENMTGLGRNSSAITASINAKGMACQLGELTHLRTDENHADLIYDMSSDMPRNDKEGVALPLAQEWSALWGLTRWAEKTCGSFTKVLHCAMSSKKASALFTGHTGTSKRGAGHELAKAWLEKPDSLFSRIIDDVGSADVERIKILLTYLEWVVQVDPGIKAKRLLAIWRFLLAIGDSTGDKPLLGQVPRLRDFGTGSGELLSPGVDFDELLAVLDPTDEGKENFQCELHDEDGEGAQIQERLSAEQLLSELRERLEEFHGSVQRGFKAMGASQGDGVSFDSFLAHVVFLRVCDAAGQRGPPRALELFRLLDVDGDGLINDQDWQAALGAGASPFSPFRFGVLDRFQCPTSPEPTAAAAAAPSPPGAAPAPAAAAAVAKVGGARSIKGRKGVERRTKSAEPAQEGFHQSPDQHHGGDEPCVKSPDPFVAPLFTELGIPLGDSLGYSVKYGLRRLAIEPPSPEVLAKSRMALKEIGLDEGSVSQCLTCLRAATYGSDVLALFRRHDLDNNGELDIGELKRIIRRCMRVRQNDLPDRDISKVFQALDVNKCGLVSADEFIEFLSLGIAYFATYEEGRVLTQGSSGRLLKPDVYRCSSPPRVFYCKPPSLTPMSEQRPAWLPAGSRKVREGKEGYLAGDVDETPLPTYGGGATYGGSAHYCDGGHRTGRSTGGRSLSPDRCRRTARSPATRKAGGGGDARDTDKETGSSDPTRQNNDVKPHGGRLTATAREVANMRSELARRQETIARLQKEVEARRVALHEEESVKTKQDNSDWEKPLTPRKVLRAPLVDDEAVHRLLEYLRVSCYGTSFKSYFSFRDEDDELDVTEVKRVIRNVLRIPAYKIADSDIKAALKLLDSDSDGRISIRELQAWMKEPHNKHVRKRQKPVEPRKAETRGGQKAYQSHLLRKRQLMEAEVGGAMSDSTGRATPMQPPWPKKSLSSKGCQADFTESESDDVWSHSPVKEFPTGTKDPAGLAAP